MCLAVPAKVLKIEEGNLATVELRGVERQASLMLLPEARVGDFVLVHAGFAMQLVSEAEVRETEALWAEMNGAPRTVEHIAEEAEAGDER